MKIELNKILLWKRALKSVSKIYEGLSSDLTSFIRHATRLTMILTLTLLPLTIYHLPLISAASGKTTANYLNVDVGAKAAALAGSQFGSENDSFAQFYNPALLSGISQKEIGVMHNEFFEDVRQEIFTYVHPTKRYGTFATAINYFTYGKIQGYNAEGSATGKLTANDMMIGTSWARKWNFIMGETVMQDFSAGGTIKVLSKTLDDETAMGFAVDLGFSYPFTSKYLNGLKVGGSLMNFGSGLKVLS